MDSAVTKYIARQSLSVLPQMDAAFADGLFVVVPAYFENDTLPVCIESLLAADRTSVRVNLLVVLNYGSNDDDHVKSATWELERWCRHKALSVTDDRFRLIGIPAYDLPPKQKGAGLARKIGMDQVVAFCASNHIADSVMVSLDADTVVASNYFTAISDFFKNGSNLACSIYFEHPLGNWEAPSPRDQAIALYELHLRYYRQALKAAGFPNAIHTVGSAMAFKTTAYAKAGGMVQKQAGEDFYFLHKVINQGGFGEVNTTTVYPSSRASTRVIFGTGATIHKMENEGLTEYPSYNIQSFIDLSELFLAIGKLYENGEAGFEQTLLGLPGRMRSFLVNNGFDNLILPVLRNCASVESFAKRFFEVFNAFQIIKYLNFTHDHFLEKPEVCDTAAMLLENNGLLADPFADVFGLLDQFRAIDKKGIVLKLL